MSTTGPEVFSRAHFGSGGDLYLENVQCDGSESRLEDCPVSGVQCSHSEVAGISCQGTLALSDACKLHTCNKSIFACLQCCVCA